MLRAWCDYVPEILPVARALEAALVTGDEGGRRGASAWASCTRCSPARSTGRARAGLDGRDRHRLGLGARPALRLRPPGGRAGLDAPSSRARYVRVSRTVVRRSLRGYP